MTVLAIDPGTNESAYVQWRPDARKLLLSGIIPNEQLLALLTANEAIALKAEIIAIEMVACYGMAVGKEVFETCVWIGRFYERCSPHPRLVYRRDVKMHHCQSVRAKDANVRQALIDKYGAPGTKKQPGVTYGLKSHLWAAFAIATFISETADAGGTHRSSVGGPSGTGLIAGVPPACATAQQQVIQAVTGP